MMCFSITFLFYCLINSLMAAKIDPSLTGMLEADLSPEAFADFNTSKEYKPFNISEFHTLSRRYDLWWYSWFAVKHHRSTELTERGCYLVSTTFQMAYPEIMRYYEKRFLYVNTLEYEVGYLVQEIVWKYQMMVEIYQLVYKRYYMAQDKNYAPVSYLFNMYLNVLEYSMAVIHLCNMLHELEKKYEADRHDNIFADYDDNVTTRSRRRRTRSMGNVQEKDNYFKQREEQKRIKQKERKKERKKFEQFGVFELTTPTRKPKNKKSSWPLDYGWSIENW